MSLGIRAVLLLQRSASGFSVSHVRCFDALAFSSIGEHRLRDSRRKHILSRSSTPEELIILLRGVHDRRERNIDANRTSSTVGYPFSDICRRNLAAICAEAQHPSP